MMNRRVILSSLLLLASAAMPAMAEDLDKPTTKGSVSIQLPKGWQVGAGGIMSAQAPQADKDPTGTFQPSLQISQAPGTKLDGAAQQATVKKTIDSYQAIEKPTPYTTASGMQGINFGGTYKIGTTALRSRQYMFLVNGQLYTLTFTCLASHWNTYAPTLEACVATFNVKK